MDRWMEQQDGWTRWEYGKNQVDGKDEEECCDEFFFLSVYLSFLSYISNFTFSF
jgi:hypothetical protein